MFDGDLWSRAGSTRRILRGYAAPVQDASGEALGSIEVYSDVTQIQEVHRLKDEFVAAAAHDLKTPITAIKGCAQIALRLARRIGNERLAQQLAMINSRSDDLTYLMDALLDMSRIQAGRMMLDIEQFDVRGLINKVIAHFEFDLRRRKRDVRVELPEMQVEVAWDRARIEGVLINLISNALKYSPDGEPIEVRLQRLPNGWLGITVTDRGIGIPPAERTRIFERFYRTPLVIEQGFKGTGIGLHISQIVVDLHGGRLWASDGMHGDGGTTMHAELPQSAPGPA